MATYDKETNQNSPTAEDGDNRDTTKTDLDKLNSAETSPANPKKPKDLDDLDVQEKSGGQKPQQPEDLSGFAPTFGGAVGFAKKNKGKALVGGVVAGAFALFILGILSLGAYKLETIMNNIQDRFAASTSNATTSMTNRLITNYIVRTMWTDRCGSPGNVLVNRNCTAYNGNSLVGKLYTGWRQAKVEDDIFKKFGYSFEYDNRSGGYTMYKLNLDGTRGDVLGIPESLFDDFNNSPTFNEYLRTAGNFDTADRNQIRNALDGAIKHGTWYDRTIFRIKVSRFMEKKYGVKLCVVACFLGRDQLINSFRDWRDDNSINRAAKRWIAQRVIQPKNELYGLMIRCLYTGSNLCDPRRVVNAEPSEYNADEGGCTGGCKQNGESLSESDRDIQGRLIALAATEFGSDKERLDRYFAQFRNSSFLGLIFRGYVQRVDDEGESRGNATARENNIASRIASGVGGRAIPILGWVMMASDAILLIQFADESLPKLQYQAQEVAAIQTYMTFKTHRDEEREGLTDAALTGSFAKLLEGGNQTEDGSFFDGQFGGHGSGESSPAWLDLVATNRPVEYRSPVASLFSGKAFAADDGNAYECADFAGNDLGYNNVPIEPGQRACPEEKFYNKSLFSSMFREINVGVLADAAAMVDRLTSWIDDIIGRIASLLGFDDLISDILGLLGQVGPIREVMKWLAFFVLGSGVFNHDVVQSGARTMQHIIAGADASFNKFNQNGIGGVALSSKQISENLEQYYERSQDEFNSKSWLAKVFDASDHRSVLGKMSLKVPSSLSTDFGTSALNIAKSTFTTIGNVFGNLFGLASPASAQTISYEDPFGITQYGYPVDDPIFDKDPEQFWLTNCTTDNPNNLTGLYNRYASLNIDNDTKLPKNDRPNPNHPNPEAATIARQILAISPTGTNGCLLIQAAVGAAGALFTDGVLSPEELADSQDPAPPSGGGGGGGGECDRDTWFPGYEEEGFTSDTAYMAAKNPPPSGDGTNYGNGAAPVKFPGVCRGPGSDDAFDLSYTRNTGGGNYQDSTGINYDDRGLRR